MDKTAIKNFAVRARNKLIEQVKQKAFEIGIEKGKFVEPEIKENDLYVLSDYKTLNNKEYEQRKRLINEIELKGYEQVIEEVAYTWFNRFVALRFMEVNGYLPTGVRVLSSETEGKVEPDIVTEALNIIDLDVDTETVYQYQDDNNTEGLFKYLLIKQCNSLYDIMPFIFEKIADYTEILLPNNLLSEGSVIRYMVESISEKDWAGQVEIIGWLYQFYISEKKDKVFASKGKVKKEEIPAVTQLFTPDWIVKYMVENSLGRYWLESNINENLKRKWEYYLEEPEQESEVQEKLEEIRHRNIYPEAITVLDPACGSGHILVYAFDVLFNIYKTVGYLESDIPQLILNNNLYGLEICDRAAQLASFSVMMKAREKDSRIFEKDVSLNICAIQESNGISSQTVDLLINKVNNIEEKEIVRKSFNYLIKLFNDAKNYGSILNVSIELDILEKSLLNLNKSKIEGLFEMFNKEILLDILPKLIKQAKIISNKYDIVITNPPYMGNNNMNKELKDFIKNEYNISKRDLFAVFIERCIKYSKKNKYIAMITQQSWMFLKSFEEIRELILRNFCITSLLQLGPRAFEEIGGEVVQTVSFVLQNNNLENYKGLYKNLTIKNNLKKKKDFFNDSKQYITKNYTFKSIPHKYIAYWTSNKVNKLFLKEKNLSAYGDAREGMATADNNRFLRYWYEVDHKSVEFNAKNRKQAKTSGMKWFPYNKGGGYRRWYGNKDYLVNWKNDGYEIRNNKDKNGRIRSHNYNLEYIFKQGITWSSISSSNLGARFSPKGALSDSKGPTYYCNQNNIKYILGFMNSKPVQIFLKVLAPTLDYKVGDIANLPLIIPNDSEKIAKINNLVNKCLYISKNDWNSFESSWDFKKHPLLTHKGTAQNIEDAFNNWSDYAEKQFYQLKKYEEELNRIFLEIYGLEDELTPEVDEGDVTVRRADRERDIKSFISYAVGCMFGRYSLDEEGLVYAGGEFDESRYDTFKVDKDGIIPILDDEYFDDDIVARFIKFLKVTFCEEHLEENLDYIAETLGRKSKETSRQAIRRYYVTNFIKDHVQTYSKRPIYWLFQSDGRRKAFNALIYMHRYDSGTVARVRTDYLHELQKKIEAEKVRLQGIIDSDLSAREINKAKKKFEKLNKDTEELIKYDEVLNHMANQQIEIDLDDGVQENYEKFADVLTRI